MIDPDNEEQVALVAEIAYAWSFGVHNGGADWPRIVENAKEGGGYSDVIVQRCYGMARHVLAALLELTKTTDLSRKSDVAVAKNEAGDRP